MKFSRILFYLSLITAAAFLLSGYGYQWDLWGLGTGFTVLRYSAYSAIALTAVSAGTYWFVRNSGFLAKAFTIIAFLLMGSATATALYWQQEARSVPPIHDISTDLDNPPAFSAIVRLRTDAPNPPEYAGEETAQAQREAYPGIQPIILPDSVQPVMDHAVDLILDRDWEIVAINRDALRIEATEKLAWFGFKDDVVLRFTETDEGTRVDMRSKSRIGRSDVGVNAKRIDRFLTDLENRVE
ncbi:DUF1499 domain-containing protein [Rhodohalobacter mucosus]|uniref:DUF1499 domain-containing protein n=1 Tax=Rhodohalobacter mucosus TaxID=2079485 RepID=A0A316TNM2_9BACT|nr:DUF1499 domain-containing protein [Rhodohalobacter mucosus]PWN05378.1 DUF1499 domain-containing protein [Rhodohalobacter mucosus]